MGMEADWRRRIMTRDGAAIMENVGLERRQMRRFGEFEEKSYGGIRERHSVRQWWEDLARSVVKE
jgi:hypothetical protein